MVTSIDGSDELWSQSLLLEPCAAIITLDGAWACCPLRFIEALKNHSMPAKIVCSHQRCDYRTKEYWGQRIREETKIVLYNKQTNIQGQKFVLFIDTYGLWAWFYIQKQTGESVRFL